MHHDQICEVVRLADFDEILENVAASVNTRGVRNDQLELFLESDKSLTRVATRCYQKFGVAILSFLIFVVNV